MTYQQADISEEKISKFEDRGMTQYRLKNKVKKTMFYKNSSSNPWNRIKRSRNSG